MSSSGRKRRKPERTQREREPGIKTRFPPWTNGTRSSPPASFTALCPHLPPKGPGGASGCSQRSPAGSHGGAAEEDPDEGASTCESDARAGAPHGAPVSSWFFLLLVSLQHDESSRRHMEQIEQRKEKAAELSSGRHANTDYAPKLTPYERKKQCSLCCVEVRRIGTAGRPDDDCS